jgi:hypothetical protein
MRSALLVVIAVLAVAGGGYALCAAAGWPFHAARVVPAAMAALVAAGAAFIPMVLSRGATQAGVAQAALVGTMVHLFGCLAGATVFLFVLKQGIGSTYWVLAFYWATLAALVIEFGRIVRAAPPAGPSVTPASPAGPKQ